MAHVQAVDASDHLVEAAVAAQAGRVRFHVGDPSAWYGQAIDPNQPSPLPQQPLRRIGDLLRGLLPPPRAAAGERAIVEVPSITLGSLLGPLRQVDLIDLDVQGVEDDVLEEAAAQLDAKVHRRLSHRRL